MQNLINKKFFLLFLLLFLPAFNVEAATLFIETNTTQAKVGDIVTASVYVNADGQSINNVEGIISVPSDILEIQSVNVSGSDLNLWVEQPSYSKSAVNFNGGIPNPGYSGVKGKVLTIFLKATKSGSAPITFQSASVRANDGLGTDVLKVKYGTTVNVSSLPVIPETAPVISSKVPNSPIVSSSLTPDSDKWYKTDVTTFSWNLPNDVVAVQTLLGQHSDSVPSIVYAPAISKKTVENLGDGVWYFHIRYQNEAGWGKITHKKIQIDNTSPNETEINYSTLDSGLVELSLLGSDETSSIDKYVLSTEGKEKVEITNINENGEARYVFGADYFGNREIKVETFDKAGNLSETFVTINFPYVEQAPAPIEIETPETKPDYLVWGNKIISVLSVLVPILAIILLFALFVYLIFKKFILVDRSREKRINKIEKDAMLMIDALRDNIKEDIHLFRADKTIENTNEAEKVLLKNLLMDFKHIEKAINTRLRKTKIVKKDIEENSN